MATYETASTETGTTAAGELPDRDPARPLAASAPLYQPILGEDGQPCAVCDAPLASDQRYCLRCGTRRAEARLPFEELLREPRVRERERELLGASAAPALPPPWYLSPFAGLAGLAALALIGLGILVGTLLDDPAAPPRPIVQKPPVVNITNTGGAPAAPGGAASAFVGDWPEGQDGWTVQLKTLLKDGTLPDAVSAAKDDVAAKGAPDVGALDSDSYPSLDPGSYVIYSGVFDSRKQAARAARKLSKDYPGAKPVKVSGGAGAAGGGTATDKAPAKTESKSALRKKERLTPEQYQRQQRKPQPIKLKSQGKAPKKDNKKPGGGSGATEIG